MDITNAEFTSVYLFATEQAKVIGFLHYADLVLSIIIALIVGGILAYVIVRFREKPGDAEPLQDHGNTKLEIGWTVGTGLILAVLGVLTAGVMYSMSPPLGTNQPDVIVIGHQWWWEYRYPKLGIITANELFLPQGMNLLFEVRGADVVHSFWIPAFGQKMDAIPGHPNFLFYKPIRSGIYLGTCSEYCGADHGLMRIIATVLPVARFNAWAHGQAQVPPEPTVAQAIHGKQLFMANTCIQCHSISGTGAKARVGPDLTHIGSRTTLGSGVIPNDLPSLASWITNPQKFKPGCYMPNMRLKPADAHDIAAYLETLK